VRQLWGSCEAVVWQLCLIKATARRLNWALLCDAAQVTEFKKDQGIDLSKDKLAVQRLREASEKVGFLHEECGGGGST
jgi:hypothetical protein